MEREPISEITGQNGVCVVEFLPAKRHEAHGTKRCDSSFNSVHIDRPDQNPHDPKHRLYYGGGTDAPKRTFIIRQIQPEEICNTGVQSHVHGPLETSEPANADSIDAGRREWLRDNAALPAA